MKEEQVKAASEEARRLPTPAAATAAPNMKRPYPRLTPEAYEAEWERRMAHWRKNSPIMLDGAPDTRWVEVHQQVALHQQAGDAEMVRRWLAVSDAEFPRIEQPFSADYARAWLKVRSVGGEE